jgi:hypothetical protein
MQLTFQLIQENKPTNPCIVHARELLIDLYGQANNSPGGPWVMEKTPDSKLIKFSCTLCGCKRMYKQMPEKTLLNGK